MAYKSVAWDRLSESTAPFVTDPSDDAFIWGRSRMSLTEKLDVRGILISNNLFLTTQCGIVREKRRKKLDQSVFVYAAISRNTMIIFNGFLLPLFH